jgi:hypothetical protein
MAAQDSPYSGLDLSELLERLTEEWMDVPELFGESSLPG